MCLGDGKRVFDKRRVSIQEFRNEWKETQSLGKNHWTDIRYMYTEFAEIMLPRTDVSNVLEMNILSSSNTSKKWCILIKNINKTKTII